MVEAIARVFVVIVDESKLSGDGLGASFAVPVEVATFCSRATASKLAALAPFARAGVTAALRAGAGGGGAAAAAAPSPLYPTDNGNTATTSPTCAAPRRSLASSASVVASRVFTTARSSKTKKSTPPWVFLI